MNSATGDVVFSGTGLRRVVGDGERSRVLIDGADLVVRRGEVVLLTGPSGSGKTTLLHLVSGFDRPQDGQRAWPGASADGLLPWTTVAVVPQGNGLLGELSYREHLALAAGHLRGADQAAAIERRLDDLGLIELIDRLPAETSLGQQQRLAVARALIAEPALIVADEPTSRQDHHHADLVVAALADAAAAGAGCLIASHDPLLRTIATRVLIVADGAVVEE
ncbi:MAG TPA: ATP-binding cassette domain-containing protein [Ilumatobacteraceae bacterium]|nr:ATP-binding cassette domain-containing protein [Ilumatobacteraceae bacterium]